MVQVLKILFSYIQTKYFRRFFNRQQLLKHQQNMLEKQIRFLNQHSPFYKNNKILKHFPIMDKKSMMNNFNQLNTKAIDKEDAMNLAIQAEQSRNFSPMIGNISVGLSSGTSGHRGIFLADQGERLRWAGVILAKLLPKSILRSQRVALFLRANNNLYETLGSKKIQFQFFDLIEPVEKLINSLEIYQPTILVSPPSMLRILGGAKEEGRLSISPQKIISAAEVLDPLDEKYLEKSFEQKIHQIYQCTEGFIGYTCNEGSIHLNEEFLIIEKEFIDDKRFIPIISDMERKTQPIMRYRLNDILTLKETPCPCGSVLTAISQIEGREDDSFYFSKKDGEERTIFPDFIRRVVLTASDRIEEYRVIQESKNKMRVYLKAPKGEYSKVKKRFDSFFNDHNIHKPEIDVKPYNYNRSLKKMKRVERVYEP